MDRRSSRSSTTSRSSAPAFARATWKLIWRTPLPQVVELYNVKQDPSEKNNLAAENPDKVAALQKRANELAAAMAPSPLLQTEFNAMRGRMKMPPAFPDQALDLNEEP